MQENATKVACNYYLAVVQCFSLKHWNIEIVKKQVWISQSKLVYFFDISYLICRIQPSFGPNPRPKSNIKLTQNIEEVEKKKLLILFVNSLSLWIALPCSLLHYPSTLPISEGFLIHFGFSELPLSPLSNFKRHKTPQHRFSFFMARGDITSWGLDLYYIWPSWKDRVLWGFYYQMYGKEYA